MPFIDSKSTLKLSDQQKEDLKRELGKAISVMNKSENYLMVGILDGYDLFMGGKKLEKGAFISVQVLGSVDQAQSQKMTGEICRIVSEQLDIPGSNVYVNYLGYRDWGWNGGNF